MFNNNVKINRPNVGQYQETSILCEATKPGNEGYFSAIVNLEFAVDHISPSGGPMASAIACAIFYGNFQIYQKLIELGVDINAIQNPNMENPSDHWTAFEHAVINSRFEIIWDMLGRIEPTEEQLFVLTFNLNRYGGIEGSRNQKFRQKVIKWLRGNGHEVDPMPAASSVRTR